MEIRIYNTQSKTKEIFEPLEPGKVKMYCCGPTVYDFLHVGNFRGAVFYNFVRNFLESQGYQVEYAYNFTDVDDKILKRAKDENVKAQDIAEKYIAEFKKDFAALELSPHTYNPKVTEHIGDIVSLIERIIAEGRGYNVEGEVFFSIESFKDYGKLSHRNPEDMQSGARIEVDPKKRNPLDFTLWKPAKPDEESWDSPWGKGRPGWHIECSAMNQALFGDQIDIHGGGLDLIFPHHENEIAQSEGASNKSYVRYWMHNNMFTFGGTKMSKSVGNIRTMRSFLEIYHGEIFKYLVLSVHYRSESDFTEQTINNSIAALGRVYSAMVKARGFVSEKENPTDPGVLEFQKKVDSAKASIQEFLVDDFSTPQAMASLFEVVRAYNQKVPLTHKKNGAASEVSKSFLEFVGDFGKPMELYQQDPEKFLGVLDDLLLKQRDLKREDIQSLVDQRLKARAEKDYKKSDDLRDELNQLGIEIRDTAEGTQWEVKKGGMVEGIESP